MYNSNLKKQQWTSYRYVFVCFVVNEKALEFQLKMGRHHCLSICINIHNKKHLKNVGPIHHCEPPHAHTADVASGTVACRLRIDVDDNA